MSSSQYFGHRGQTDAIRAAGDFSPNQYGFRAGRFTVDAIEGAFQAMRLAKVDCGHCRVVLLVMLDVVSTFNSASRCDISRRSFNIPGYLLKIYLKDRALL